MGSSDPKTQTVELSLNDPSAASALAYEPARHSLDSGREGTLTPSPDEPEKPQEPSPEKEDKTSTDDSVLIVGWDGPDDPANPRKYVKSVLWFRTSSRTGHAQLDQEEEMGRVLRHFRLHVHFPDILVYGGPRCRANRGAVSYHK